MIARMDPSTPDASGPGATRRDLLARLALGGAAVAATGLSGCALFMGSVEPDVTLMAENGTLLVPRGVLVWERGLGNAMVIGISEHKDKLLLIRAPDGEIIALSTTCTHRGCDVRWSTEAGHIVCPCHGSEYDAHGANLVGPATKPLRRYEVKERRESLSIAVG
jgi:nitrite reductase/ring-hydroxylating ferredoxin subunit